MTTTAQTIKRSTRHAIGGDQIPFPKTKPDEILPPTEPDDLPEPENQPSTEPDELPMVARGVDTEAHTTGYKDCVSTTDDVVENLKTAISQRRTASLITARRGSKRSEVTTALQRKVNAELALRVEALTLSRDHYKQLNATTDFHRHTWKVMAGIFGLIAVGQGIAAILVGGVL